MFRGLLAGVGLAAGHYHAGAGQDVTLRQGQPDAPGAAGHDDSAVSHVEETVECFAIHAVSRTDRDSTPRTAQPFEPAGP